MLRDVVRNSLKWLFRPVHRKVATNFLQFYCTAFLFTHYVGLAQGMEGASMLPTFSASYQIVLVDRLSVRLFPNSIRRGDMVTYGAIYDPSKPVAKRVIGLPGDIICVFPQRAMGSGKNKVEHVVVPKGHMWVSGDNLGNSRDSSEFGPIPIAMVQGKILAKIWPCQKWLQSPIKYID